MMGKFSSLGLSFANVEPDAGSKPVANGWYHCRIERWEETETKSGNAPGTLMYKLAVAIVGGKYAKRWGWTQFVMDGNDVAMGAIMAFWVAAGIDVDEIRAEDFDPNDEWGAEKLVGMELDVKFGYKAEQNGHDEANKLTDYRVHEFTDDDLLVG
jgi:hypothetical protein